MAFVVECVIEVKAELIQSVGDEEGAPTTTTSTTVMVPVALTELQPPDKGME